MAIVHDWIRRYHPVGCDPVHSRVKPGTTDKEFYDGFQVVQEFLNGICFVCPYRVLHIMMRCVKDLLPSEGIDPILSEARKTALNDNARPDDFREQLKILRSVDIPNKPYKTRKYYEIIRFLLRWRLGRDDAHVTMRILVRLEHYFQADGHKDPHGHIFRHCKKVLPFEEWRDGLMEEAYEEVPYVGKPASGYLPIGE